MEMNLVDQIQVFFLLYHLAASESKETIKMLNDLVILFDPSLNPDGLQRFAYWANTNKNMTLNPDSNDREYNEIWTEEEQIITGLILTETGCQLNIQKLLRV